MSNALLKENDDVVDIQNYINTSADPDAAFKELGFQFAGVNNADPKDPCSIWRKRLDNDVWITVVSCKNEFPKVRYFKDKVAGHEWNAMGDRLDSKMNVPIGDVRRELMNWKNESLDDADMDVESYVKKSLDPTASLKELGFTNEGTSEDGEKTIWLRRLGRGWYESVYVNNETQEIVYRKVKMNGRGFGSDFTVHDYKTHATMNDVRRRVLKWKHEDAQEVVARLLDSTADNPDAFEPNAVLELMTPHRCPTCRSHNVSPDIAEGMVDCYNCGGAFSADRVQEDADPDDAEAFIRSLPLVQPRITVSYSRTTPESSAQGEASESGWIDEEGEDMTPDSFDYEEGISAVDKAIKFLKDQGAVHPSSSHFHPDVWYSTEYQTIDYRTGEDEERNFHLKDFSPAEQQQIWDAMKRR